MLPLFLEGLNADSCRYSFAWFWFYPNIASGVVIGAIPDQGSITLQSLLTIGCLPQLLAVPEDWTVQSVIDSALSECAALA